MYDRRCLFEKPKNCEKCLIVFLRKKINFFFLEIILINKKNENSEKLVKI